MPANRHANLIPSFEPGLNMQTSVANTSAPPEAKRPRTLAFKIGILFLAINMPIGYLAILGGAAIAATSPNPRFWLISGGIVYAISWLMFLAGILLAGREGLAIIRSYWKKTKDFLRASPLFRFSLTSRGARYQFAMGIALVSAIPALGISCLAVRGFFTPEGLDDPSHLTILGLILLSAITGYTLLRRHADNIGRIRRHLDMVIENPATHTPSSAPPSDNDIEAILSSMTVVQERLKRSTPVSNGQHGTHSAVRDKMLSESTMAFAVSHDLNNIMTAVLAHAAAIRKLSTDNTVTEHAAQIEKNAGRIVDFANQMFICTGRSLCKFDPLDINTVVESAVSEHKAAVGICINRHFTDGLPTVYGDEVQLKRAVSNIFDNAVEACGESGTVTIETSVKDCGSGYLEGTWTNQPLLAGLYVAVSISDSGHGMAGDSVMKIFDPFFTTKLRRQGLGLPIALGIVHMHGGTVDLRTEPGRGSTFTILLTTVKTNNVIG